MKKLVLTFIVLLCFGLKMKAQTNLDSINMQLRTLFSNLLKPNPPRKFLYDMAGHSVDSTFFVSNNTIDTIDTETWLSTYTEMRNSAYDTMPMKLADTILNSCYNYKPDTINMLIMKYDYYKFKSNALSTNIYFNFDTVNNILTDKFPRPSFP
jgi:hypothetical protein